MKMQASYGTSLGFPSGVYIGNVVSRPRRYVEVLLLKENGGAKMSQVGRWVGEKMKTFFWDFCGSQEVQKGPGESLDAF